MAYDSELFKLYTASLVINDTVSVFHFCIYTARILLMDYYHLPVTEISGNILSAILCYGKTKAKLFASTSVITTHSSALSTSPYTTRSCVAILGWI